MRLPNGYGSVYKLSGKRRRPYAARKTIGYNEIGQPIYHYIGYYCTKGEAMSALVRYNDHPESVSESYTFKEVYEKWSEDAYAKISDSGVKGYKAAYKITEILQDMRMEDIKLIHLQEVADTSGKNKPLLRKYKVLLNKVFEYAVAHEYIDPSRKEYIQYVDIDKGNPNRIERKPFTKEEVWVITQNDDVDFNKIVLMLIYTGVRIGELLDLKSEDVHIDEKWFFIRASKTDSGIREVPIADKVMPYFRYWLKKGNEWLIPNEKGKKTKYETFRDSYWDKMMPGHLPHDTRHTCVSWLTQANVDARWIKSIVGHKGNNVTEGVYTHIDLPHKLEAINRI